MSLTFHVQNTLLSREIRPSYTKSCGVRNNRQFNSTPFDSIEEGMEWNGMESCHELLV